MFCLFWSRVLRIESGVNVVDESSIGLNGAWNSIQCNIAFNRPTNQPTTTIGPVTGNQMVFFPVLFLPFSSFDCTNKSNQNKQQSQLGEPFTEKKQPAKQLNETIKHKPTFWVHASDWNHAVLRAQWFSTKGAGLAEMDLATLNDVVGVVVFRSPFGLLVFDQFGRFWVHFESAHYNWIFMIVLLAWLCCVALLYVPIVFDCVWVHVHACGHSCPSDWLANGGPWVTAHKSNFLCIRLLAQACTTLCHQQQFS